MVKNVIIEFQDGSTQEMHVSDGIKIELLRASEDLIIIKCEKV